MMIRVKDLKRESQVETLQGLEREVARLQAEVVHLNNTLLSSFLFFILIVFKVDRLRREGEEGRRRSSSQEAHYRTTEQVGFLATLVALHFTPVSE